MYGIVKGDLMELSDALRSMLRVEKFLATAIGHMNELGHREMLAIDKNFSGFGGEARHNTEPYEELSWDDINQAIEVCLSQMSDELHTVWSKYFQGLNDSNFEK